MAPKLTLQSFHRATADDITTRLSTGSTTGSSSNPLVTPDGRFVIFESSDRLTSGDTNNVTNLYIKDLVSGTLTCLPAKGRTSNEVLDALLSPDGKTIVFTTEASLVSDDQNETYDTYLMDLNGNLTKLYSGQTGGASAIEFSADGKSLLLFSQDRLTSDDMNNNSDLYLKTIGGSMIRITPDLAQSSSIPDYSGIHFSPDGRSVLFISAASHIQDDTNTTRDVYLRKGDGSLVCLTAAALESGDSFNAQFSPDGKSILIETGSKITADDADEGFSDLYLMDIASGAMTLLTGGGSTNGDCFNGHFSSDGKRIVFESAARLTADDTNDLADIYLKDLLSGVVTRISSGGLRPGNSYTAKFSRDGKQVIFESEARLTGDDTNDVGDIYLKDLASGTITRLSSDGAQAENSYNAVFSPDGKSIIFGTRTRITGDDTNDASDLYMTNIALKANERAVVEGRFVETSFLVGNAASVSIAWGDGTMESAAPVGGKVSFHHTYASTGQKSAAITLREGDQTLVTPYMIDLASGQMNRSALASTLSGAQGRDALAGDETANILKGLGGNDTLSGGAGKDVFVFENKLGKTNAANKKTNLDKIVDFSVADDTIHLAKGVFTKIAKKGVLSKSAFWTGDKAHDASDRIVYNKKTGALWYDADGTGSKAAIQIATLQTKLKMTHADFFVF